METMTMPVEFITHTSRSLIGSMTSSVSWFCDWLIEHWESIPEAQKSILKQDLDDAFRMDDRDKQKNREFPHRLGYPADRAAWQRVLDRFGN